MKVGITFSAFDLFHAGHVKMLEEAKRQCDYLIVGLQLDSSIDRKLMDISKMKEIGWEYSTELEDGIKKTYQWFLDNIDKIKEIKL